MGPTTQNSTQKRRAKKAAGPHAAAAEKEHILEARREKNREAQHVFRKRRQAAEAAMGRRFKRLEDVVEEMSSILIGLFDDILANESLVTQYPSIISSLQRSMGRVLALTKEVAAMDDDALGLVDDAKVKSSEQAPDSKAVVANAAITHKSQPTPSAPVAPHTLADTSAPGMQGTTSRPVNSSLSIYSPTAPISAGYTPTDQFMTSLPNSLSPDDALGDSGWDTLLPKQPGYTLHPPQETFQPAYSFPFRLIEISLTHGYALITTAPLANIQREFGRTLRYRRREEIIASLQWALGAGREYMYQTSKFEFLEADPEHLPVCHSTPPPFSSPQDEKEMEPDFITAAGVYKLLKGLGAIMLDADTMEIQIRRPSLSTSGGTTGHLGWLSLYPDAFETPTTKMRLHVPQLMTQLMHIGICSETGPRYPQRDVWRTIEGLARLA
ncbi:uncharacterized protein F5Z01DRAFT_675431 [Emericellopsis atlantica]|uniref:BZIP domain-containing protein n=1 Tax=Emericellopsis atlantica TaxID=2614577 RepID=A0A9P7ZJT3_9HYPO|nr:uncharacterized protein F5Z01DRAFT_675431 [Emericellopsis atlantica]KAG9253026.1 hypothetical protein F5Z01DRAFT_675431 [Emericellopsis atlantica]